MDFFTYFSEVLSLSNLTLLFFATGAGLILGALPGLSPTMAVALLIPFTFQMSPTSGLILLGAVYTATVAGGAISGILVNIPGAPANIATILDGHPMAKQGRATEALHYCFVSSFVGGIIGVLVLVFFTPPLADLALKFGPAETFWMAIVGVTVIGTLGSKSVLKGLMSGTLGLWISTIGISPIFGESRFVFSDHLTGGVHIVVALIGLFAVPQIYQLLVTSRKQQNDGLFDMSSTPLWQSIRYNLLRIKALTIGTLSGVIVGIIPGAGGQIAGLVAYDQVRKFSKDPEQFGQGCPDGVIAAESANNAMVGPSLVPLLTLGIPGSPTAAVLLGGLLINGLFPGPDLFTIHKEVTWTFIGSLLVAQLFMVCLGLALSRSSSRWIMQVPPQYMAAAVTILAVFGTYSIQNSFSDVIVMITLGSLMYVVNKYGFSAAPLVLGIILGPIAEDNFSTGMMIADATDGGFVYFNTGVINLTLIAICVFSIGYSVWAEIKQRRKNRTKLEGSPAQIEPGKRTAAIGAILISVGGLAYVWLSGEGDAYIFPRIIGFTMLGLALLLCATEARTWSQGGSGSGLIEWQDIGVGFASIVIYIVLLSYLGFYLSSLLFFIGLTFLYTSNTTSGLFNKTQIRRLIVAIIFVAIIYGLFNRALQVITPGFW